MALCILLILVIKGWIVRLDSDFQRSVKNITFLVLRKPSLNVSQFLRHLNWVNPGTKQNRCKILYRLQGGDEPEWRVQHYVHRGSL